MNKIKLIPIIFLIAIVSTVSLANQSFALSYVDGVKLTASDGTVIDLFGHAVATSGNTLVVGAPGHGTNGAAYIFERTPGTNTWTEQKLTAAGSMLFGNTVSISGDTIVVGSPGSAQAFVYQRGTPWTLSATLSVAGDLTFGKSVSIDGDTIAVGSTGQGVHMFERSTGWALDYTILPPVVPSNFGHAVSLHIDTLVAGDPGDSAYVFVRSTSPPWVQEAQLTVGSTPEHFAQTVGVNGDTAVVGGPTDTDNGQAYVYERTGTSWSAASAVPNSSGQSVSVSDNEIVSGDAFADTVFVNDRDNSWDQFTTFLGPDANAGFGLSLFNSGEVLVVGAPHTYPNSEGAAHVFLRDLDMDTIPDLDEDDAGTGSIGDTVFRDDNENGIQDGGEPGIAGVTVTRDCLIGMDSDVTDVNGNYLFDNIPVPTSCTIDVDETASGAALAGLAQGINCPETVNETLNAGEAFLDADFCFVDSAGPVGDTVFHDLDGDGILDGGEPGIAGVDVDIFCSGGFSDSEVTDANGNYLFADVPPLDFCTVEVNETTVPSGFIPGQCPPSVNVVLPSGSSDLSVDFCFESSAGPIGDTVFLDLNSNAVQDGGEPGIAGVDVDIFCSGGFSDSDVTDANGNYLFADIPPMSSCTVDVDEMTAPSGFTTGLCPSQFNQNLNPGESFLDADFCFVTALNTIGDTVFLDLNNNGVQDGEPGIAGVTVDLSCGGGYSDSDVTDANGFYQFTGVPPLSMCNVDVDETASGAALAGLESGVCQEMYITTLGQGDTFFGADFCYVEQVTTGSIHLFGYLDVDGDGIFDPEDTAFPDSPGKTFELLDSDTNVIATQTTSNGMVWFVDLVPGEYSVRENPIPSGFDLSTLPNLRTFNIASGEELVYQDGAAMLPSGSPRVEVNVGDQLLWGNFEQVTTGSIRVFGYLDENNDGVFNSGDSAFPDSPGKTFELLDSVGNVMATQTTTGGEVWFENLVPGEYTVRENPIPSGFDLTTLPNERTFNVGIGEELVYEAGAAMLPPGSPRVEVNLGDELRWGNFGQMIQPEEGIGGTILSIDFTSLILAGTQMNAFWLVPVLVGAGIGLVYLRRK